MTGFKALLSAIAAGACLGLAPALQSEEASLLAVSDAPGRVSTSLTQPSFSFNGAMPSQGIAYEVLDWKGKLAGKGLWASGSKLQLKGLPKGYYFLKLSGIDGDVPFCVVEDPSKRVYNPESFYAMDTAQSWLAAQKANNPRQPKDGFAAVSDICKLAGLTNVRERMSWGEVEKDPFVYSWGRYMVNAKLLAERGIKISGMFHDAPKWARGSSGKLPDNLLALHEFCRTAGIAMKGKMNAWEFWNEEDISFCDQPSWDFAAAQKAAFLGFRQGCPDTPVLMGALCRWPLPEFSERIFDNGVADYFDIFNFHSYFLFKKYPLMFNDLQSLLARHGAKSAPVWITENGSNYEGNGRIDSFIKDVREHDKDQELVLAEFTPKSQILMQSLGVARDFFFVLPAYNEKEGSKAWGLLRYDYSAKPAYAAFATLTSQLSNAKYLGTVALVDGVKGFLYEQPDKSQTLAFWSESDLDKASNDNPKIDIKSECAVDFALELPSSGSLLGVFGSSRAPLKLVDMMGGESVPEIKDDSAILRASRYPAYLSGLKGMAPTSPAPIVPAVDLARKSAKDLSIVFKLKLGDGFKHESKTVALLSGESAKLTLEIYNFSPDWKTGSATVSGELAIEGLPQSIEIAPYGKASFDCKASPKLESQNFRGKAIFGGVFNGKETSPLRMDFNSSLAMERGTISKSMEFMSPERWRKNASGDMEIYFDKAESAVKFQTKFKPGDHWVYPEYVLKLPGESLAGAIGVTFEIKAVQKGAIDAYSNSLLMALVHDVKESGDRVDFDYVSPTKDWNRAMIFFGSMPNFDPAKVKMLRLGMNPKNDELTFWVRDMKVVYAK